MNAFQAYCMVSIAPVRAEAKDQSEIVTQLLFGEIITVESVNEPWAKITTFADGYTGYIDYKHFRKLTDKEVKRWLDGLSYQHSRERLLMTPWGKQRICRGSFIPENLDTFNIGKDEFQFMDDGEVLMQSPVEYAEDYLNTPYLWGGKSPFGIDCSGITQIIYRLFDRNLPRDASEQVLIGADVDIEDIQAGDLAYFENDNGKITHVGILDGQGEIIHAAGHVRRDRFDNHGIWHKQKEILTHKLNCIKRV